MKLSRKESSFPAELPLINSVGAAKSVVARDTSKICGFVPQGTKIRMPSNERD